MTTTIEVRDDGRTKYSAEQVKTGLTVLALCSGNAKRAAAELKGTNAEIPALTLATWKKRQHAFAYKQIVEEELPTVYAGIAERCEDLAFKQAELEEKLVDKLRANLADLPPREVANALRNVATSKAINIDKSSVIRGRPTEIREDRTMGDIARALERFAGVVKVNPTAIDTTATEVAVSAD